MAKKYIQPTIEVMAVSSMKSICAASGTTTKSIYIPGGGTSTYSDEGLFQ